MLDGMGMKELTDGLGVPIQAVNLEELQISS